MRIAVNTRFLLGNQLEGIGRYTHQLLKRVVAMRPNDEFLFCFDRPFSNQFIYADNVTGRVVYPQARHPVLWYAWFEWGIPAALKDWKADVFVSLDGYLSLSSQVPSLLVIHDLAYVHFPEQVPFLVRKYYEHYLPRFARRAAILATVSKFSKKDLQDQFNLHDKDIAVVYNGAPKEWALISAADKTAIKDKWTKGRPYFCALGAIHPRKNIAGMIKGFDAFKQKNKGDHQLIIIGRMAWQTGEVKAALDNSPFKGEIQCIGYQPDETVHQLLGSATGLLFLSLFEGFGVPMIEAMQLGVPIVFSNKSVIPEVAGAAGVEVDPMNPEEIAAGMQEIINPENKAGFSRGAGQQLAKYDWDQSAKQLNALIDRLKS